ncbi:hypothetical protein GCM10019016_072760 [Streptomyces prasinosporus]|uniref:Response regulatory domain-containing protein n=1 Tax=Streptomyces prasinosporus TaxID=68256 RepID=A0ABP6U1J0_9ACTN
MDAFLESGAPGADDASGTEAATPTGRRRRRAAAAAEPAQPQLPVRASGEGAAVSGGTGRRRGRPAENAPAENAAGGAVEVAGGAGVSEGAVVTAAEHAAGTAASNTGLGGTVPPQGVPAPAGRRARHDSGEQHALPPALPAPSGGNGGPDEASQDALVQGEPQPTGRRRRALAAATERAAAQEAAPRTVFALPPAEADQGERTGQAEVLGQVPGPQEGPAPHAGGPGPAAPGDAQDDDGRHDAVPHDRTDDHTPPQPHPTSAPTGRRRRAAAQPGVAGAPQGAPVPAQGVAAPSAVPPQGVPVPQSVPPQGAPVPPEGVPVPQSVPPQGAPVPPEGVPVPQSVPPQGAPVPPQGAPVPAQGVAAPSAVPPQGAPVPPQGVPVPGRAPQAAQPPVQAPAQAPEQPVAAQPLPAEAPPGQGTPSGGTPAPQQWPAAGGTSGAGTPVPPAPDPAPNPAPPQPTPSAGTPLPPEGAPAQRAAQPLPAEAAVPVDPHSTQGRAISVRTLGQGVPFNQQAAQVQQPLPSATPPPQQPGGSGRRRKLGTRPDPAAGTEQGARPHPPAEPAPARTPAQAPAQAPAPAQVPAQPQPQHSLAGQSRLAPATEGTGRSYAIGAPDADAAEGPEPLDGPGGAVEVADPPRPQPMDDELPPEPLDNPRRLLVWPAPDVSTQQALSDRGYRPVIVHSREEVDAQIAAFPAALFVDPLTGPITRTALQSLRQAAVAAEVPVLVTAGLGQASRDAAYGADPAVLLKALAPRDSEQHPPRVLLVEEHAEIALALTATLERRGMQVARAASDADAVALAGHFRPNLVVMDLMQVHRRQAGSAGIIDWLRANGQLNRTPLVVYTAAVDQADLPRLASGETVLFLAERSTSAEVQAGIVDLLARIGTN